MVVVEGAARWWQTGEPRPLAMPLGHHLLPRVIGFYARLTGPAAEPGEAVGALHRMAEIQHAELAQPHEAFETLRQALLLDVDTQQTLERYPSCIDKAKRARFYIAESRAGR